jgi:hypothetical protein
MTPSGSDIMQGRNLQRSITHASIVIAIASMTVLTPSFSSSASAQENPIEARPPKDTLPYTIDVTGQSAEDLKIQINGYSASSVKSYPSSFAVSISAPFLYSNQINYVEVTSAAEKSVKFSVKRGDNVLCDASFGEPCGFDATPAYHLVEPTSVDEMSAPCADAAFIDKFLEPLTPYQKYHAERFFNLDTEALQACSIAPSVSDELSVAAIFDAAPSPNAALHSEFPTGTTATLLVHPAIAIGSKDPQVPQDASAQASAHLIIEIDGIARRVPVLDPYDAIMLLTQTR